MLVLPWIVIRCFLWILGPAANAWIAIRCFAVMLFARSAFGVSLPCHLLWILGPAGTEIGACFAQKSYQKGKWQWKRLFLGEAQVRARLVERVDV
jgi:hypothetical protein